MVDDSDTALHVCVWWFAVNDDGTEGTPIPKRVETVTEPDGTVTVYVIIEEEDIPTPTDKLSLDNVPSEPSTLEVFEEIPQTPVSEKVLAGFPGWWNGRCCSRPDETLNAK